MTTLEDRARHGQGDRHEYIVMPWDSPERRKTLDDWKNFARSSTALADGTRCGIQFAYHNHDFEFLQTRRAGSYDVLLRTPIPSSCSSSIDLYWINKRQDPLA